MSRAAWNREGSDWPNRTASRFIEAGGVRWHVQVAGAGPVILLLHGTGAATHSWRDILPDLARDFTVVAPDLIGHGFTGRSRAGAGLPFMAHAVAALMASLSLSPDLIVGHSAGAAIAVQMVVNAGAHPQAIISVNGALLPFPGIAATLFPALAQMLFVNPLVPRLFTLQAAVPGAVGRFLNRSTGSTIDAAGISYYERLMRTSDHCAGALAMMASWDLIPIKAALPALGVPLIVVYGDKDAAVPPNVAIETAKLANSEPPYVMAGKGHLAPEEAPDEFSNIIRDAWRAGSS